MNSFTAYIAIGSIIAGLTWGSKSEECGTWQDPEALVVIAVAIAWPAFVVAAIFFEAEPQETVCDPAL